MKNKPSHYAFLSGQILSILLLSNSNANANFIVDPNPGGDKFFNGAANKDVASFTGNVGGQNSGPEVTVTTTQNVDTGAGFANITPVKGTTLSSLTFTPQNPNLFEDFSFRGQLASSGNVTVTVQDNQGDSPQTFTFSIAKANQDFDRIGIIAKAGSNETIKSVTISNASFNQVKQVEFSAVPLPASVWLFGSALAGLGVFNRRKQAATVA